MKKKRKVPSAQGTIHGSMVVATLSTQRTSPKPVPTHLPALVYTPNPGRSSPCRQGLPLTLMQRSKRNDVD